MAAAARAFCARGKTEMRTPPGVAASAFADVLSQFSKAVGQENVYSSEADLDLYRDAYSVFWGEQEERVASAAVAPNSVEEVQQVVKIANQHRIPLYPISTGRNLGYGGSAPGYSGSVVLDLKRMNRVVEVNEDLHYAIVEPGVSYFDLHNYLREKGINLYGSVANPGWGSPIGNALDHGFGAPAGDHFKNHCGMEVVLANGDVVRTGLGALPNSKLWALAPYGCGPYFDGIFTQSNFGIVTKMGFNLFKEPDASRQIIVGSRNYNDLDAIAALSVHLEAIGVSAPGPIISPLMGSNDPEAQALLNSSGGGSAQAWNELAARKNKDLYDMIFRFSGATKIVDAQIETVKDQYAAKLPGVTFTEGKAFHGPLDDNKVDEPDKFAFGIPSLWRFLPDLSAQGWTGHAWFSPMIPRTGEAMRKANRVFQEAVQSRGLKWRWQGGVPTAPKTTTILYSFNITKVPEENKKTREAFLHLVQVAAEQGWSEYRTAPAFMDEIMNVFSFNNHALRRFHETLKDAVDPNGILSAGRYGIWPKHLRSKRT